MIHTDRIILLWSSKMLVFLNSSQTENVFSLVQHKNEAESRQCQNEETAATKLWKKHVVKLNPAFLKYF